MRTANANLDILFIAGFGPIVLDTAKSRTLYGDVMRIPFEEETGEYLHTEACAVAPVAGCAVLLRQGFVA